jgi:hypothetical protein
MQSKKEIMSDLKFCKDLMDRLVKYADKHYIDTYSYGSNHTVIQNDIIRLRRELMSVNHKLNGF